MHPFIVASFNAQSEKGNDMACERCEISTSVDHHGVQSTGCMDNEPEPSRGVPC